MKIAAITAAATLVATSVSAMDLGGGFSAGATAEAEYNLDTEAEKLTLTPYAGYAMWGIDWTVETELDMQNLSDEELDLDWAMKYTIMDGLKAYVEVSTDQDFEAENLTVGASFTF